MGIVSARRQRLESRRWRNAARRYRGRKFRLFFFSREKTRIHVHAPHPDGEAKFWALPEVKLAASTGLNERQLREAQSVIETHLGEIKNAWFSHFGA